MTTEKKEEEKKKSNTKQTATKNKRKNDENWMIEDDFRRENSAHDARAELCATRAHKKKL